MIKYLLVFLISFNLCAQTKYIAKDTPAYYDGYLFTVDKTKSIRKELIEKDKLAIFNKTLLENLEIQKKVINNQTGQVKILLDQNEKLAKQIDNDHSFTTLERVFWFSLGIAAAGFAVYGAKQIVK
jgi:hypothetical protein